LRGRQKALTQQRDYAARRLAELADYLALAPKVDDALEKLGHELFGKLAEIIEHQLTFALQEVLTQPIRLKVKRDFKRGAATMGFYIERDGQAEDILRGQGGSVANILSVGLRIFALSQLDEVRHRRFLLLDEQDCWLAPELVPRLVRIVRDAGSALGFQVIMISHHSTASFQPYADRVYRFVPTTAGVTVEQVGGSPRKPDA
jgi:DNA repair exonuclease SbcCD ATPase subunit